jgi:DNA-binding SARP family transcriptional activator
MEPLRIHLLGGFLLQQGERTLPPIPSRAARSLLAYLVVHRDRTHQRELLAGLFWPETPENRARRRLSHTLWQIQDTLEEASGSEPYLLTTPDTLAFNPEAHYWLDCEEFERDLEAVSSDCGSAASNPIADLETLRSCVELYRGDFLAGFYEDWVVVQQDHWRERYLAALGHLVQLAKGRGDHEEALGYARRLTHHDPLREEGHQEVMRLCFLSGRINEALQQYERCRSILAEELGAEPSPATTELNQKILRHRRARILPEGSSGAPVLFDRRAEVPFVGREQERRTLVDAMEHVLGGGGGAVLVEGEPGLGKTRLTAEAAEDARWRGFEILWGSSIGGSVRPYGALGEALRSGLSHLRAEQLAQQVEGVWLREVTLLVPELAGWFPELPPPAPLKSEEEPQRMREALARTLAALGRVAPHLLVLDDLHWADRDTLRALADLGPVLRSTRVLLCLLYRSEEARGDPRVWEVLRELDRSAGLGRVVLAPLSVFELGELVGEGLGLATVSPGLASRLHQETGGNALFVLETLQALRDGGVLRGAEDAPSVEALLGSRPPVPVADRVKRVIVDRASLLSAGVRSVLDAAAVCGPGVGLELLAEVADPGRPEVVDALDELLHRRLLVEEEDGYRFRHEQILRVVYEAVGPDERRELHRRAARALEASGSEDAVELARHHREGEMPDRAARYLVVAAERAAQLHAYETALEHYLSAEEAARAAGWPPDELFGIVACQEEALDVLGRREEQGTALDHMAAAAKGRPDRTAEVERRRAWVLAHADRFGEAAEAARRSASLARELGDRAGETAALVALGMCLRLSGRAAGAVPILEQAVRLDHGDRRVEAEARAALGNTLTELQRYGEGREHLSAALDLYRELADPRGEAEVLVVLGAGAMEQGDTQAAETRYLRALEVCREIGYRHGEGVNLVNLGNLLYVQGLVGEALRRYDEAIEVFEATAHRRGRATVLANDASVRHTVLGDDDRAGREAQEALSYFEGIGDPARVAQCLDTLAGIERRRGQLAEARRHLVASLRKLAAADNRWFEAQHWRSLALLELEAGDPEGALQALDRADRLCHQAGLSDLAVELLSIRGAALLARGEAAAAVRATARATEGLRPGVERPHLVLFRHHLAARAAGREEEARDVLEAAHARLRSALAGLSEEERVMALEVPEHQAIEAAWEQLQPRRILARLPEADAPTGRPLREDEWREVRWTVEDPADERIGDRVERRRHRLLRLLEDARTQGGSPTIDHLAEALGVSSSTLRRDLAALREEGRPAPTRGTRSA